MKATVRVQAEPFDLGAELAALTAGEDGVGGVGCFLGVVRGGSGLRALCLEHYPGMTERALHQIAGQADARWPLLGCTIVHRIGRLAVGAPIVLVLAASAHRSAAMDATRFLIDWLKTDAPFWKSEEFADGARRWVSAHPADAAARDRWLADQPTVQAVTP